MESEIGGALVALIVSYVTLGRIANPTIQGTPFAVVIFSIFIAAGTFYFIHGLL